MSNSAAGMKSAAALWHWGPLRARNLLKGKAMSHSVNKQAAVRRPVGLTQIQPGGDVGNLAAPARLKRRFLVLGLARQVVLQFAF